MTGNSTLVSVVIPAYNHEKYIEGSIQSIINQTHENIELIIIDDGSKDSTFQKMLELKDLCEKRFSRVFIDTQENMGTSRTLNKLLTHVKGQYVYMMTSDDLAKPTAIEKQLSFLESDPELGLVVADNEYIDSNDRMYYLDENGYFIHEAKKAKYLTFAETLNIKSYIENNTFGTYPALYRSNHVTNGYLVRKEAFERILPFTKEAPLEDWFLMLQISKYYKIKFIDEVLFSYRQHDTNTAKNIQKMKEITEKTFEFEHKILQDIDVLDVLPDVRNVMLYGALYKKTGIPFLFEILTFKKHKKKIKVVKIFNIKVFKYSKDIK